MELYAFHLVAPVAKAHDHSVFRPGGYYELGRYSFGEDRERVIARGFKSLRQVAEDRFAVVQDAADFAMHQRRSRPDYTSERLAHRLMTQADAEDRQPRCEV